MSELIEFLKLVPKGLKNADKVVEGLYNNVKNEYNMLPEDEQKEILRRQLICMDCPFFSLNLFNNDEEYQKLYNKKFEANGRKGEFCGICGCPKKTKTSSLSSDCGIKDYNEEFPNNKQPLKWESYNKTK